MFKPLNRHILITRVEEKVEEKESLVLVPDDYKVKTSPYGLYTVIQVAPDCEKVSLSFIGVKIVVNESMIEEVAIRDKKYYLVLENYIYGQYQEG
tara:strand:+ start:397 stop:681 length:285 start_codon:yes stop_codon:yes gene_type:complete